MKTAITPTRTENFPEWYQNVIKSADLSESSAVRGCMTIKPYGYALWENMQQVLDKAIKDTGHVNAYFPLLIPVSYLEKEAQHVDGFATECAVVTHHKLTKKGNKLVPDGKLEEPFVIRPTSEMIIGDSFAKWIQSYRDLPLLINQWANVMRWEMRTRLFLRTSEFLWQEGHTAHETEAEAREETKKMLNVYYDFVTNYLAIPIIKGKKTEEEKFPGAKDTYTIEGMMQDGKALQLGTSHFLEQNFAKSMDIKFLGREGTEEFAWTTSWGVSTRLIGGIIMTHSDDNGLVMPPRIAPHHVIILPLYKDNNEKKIDDYCEDLQKKITTQNYHGRFVAVTIDKRDIRGGEKYWQSVKKGYPIRIEVGEKEMKEGVISFGRRDLEPTDRKKVIPEKFLKDLTKNLDEMHEAILKKANDFREENTKEITSLEKLEKYFFKENSGFAIVHWDTSLDMDKKAQEYLKKFKISTRCIVEETKKTEKCIFSGKNTSRKVILAKAY